MRTKNHKTATEQNYNIIKSVVKELIKQILKKENRIYKKKYSSTISFNYLKNNLKKTGKSGPKRNVIGAILKIHNMLTRGTPSLGRARNTTHFCG